MSREDNSAWNHYSNVREALIREARVSWFRAVSGVGVRVGAASRLVTECVSRSWRSVRQLTHLALAIATNLPAVTRRNLDGSPLALNPSVCGYGCRSPACLCRSDRVHSQEEVRVVPYTTNSWLTQVYHPEILRGFLETSVQFCA